MGKMNSNEISDKSLHGLGQYNRGIDMLKLQQLKANITEAYHPPKLDYLNQMKNPTQFNRSNLISAADLLKDKGLKAFAKKVVKKLIGRA